MDEKTGNELLLRCLGAGDNEATTARLSQLSTADWDELIRQSRRHSVTPLLYYRIKAIDPAPGIPAQVIQKLREIYLFSAESSIKRYHELSKWLRSIQNEGIQVIVLKGAALAELIYPNIALRPMFDVDLLIKAEDFWRIDEILSGAGFKSDKRILLSKRHIYWVRHIAYMSKAIQLELHPGIYELPNLRPWANVAHAKIASVDTLVLGPEDLLLHTCIHLLDHMYIREDLSGYLIWWYDIASILKFYQEELNWDYVMRVVEEHEIEASINRVLRATSEWAGSYVPAEVLGQLADDGVFISLNDIMNQRQVQKSKTASLLPYIPFISGIRSIKGRIYHVFRSVLPCREYMMHRYAVKTPNSLYFYYFVRMGLGVVKALKTLYHLPSHLKSKRSSFQKLRDDHKI
jgi:hypothetical protein